MFVVVNEIVPEDLGVRGRTAVLVDELVAVTECMTHESAKAAAKCLLVRKRRPDALPNEIAVSDSFDDVMDAIHDTGCTVVNVGEQP